MLHLSIYQIIIVVISGVFTFDRAYKYINKEHGQSFFKFISTFIIWGTISIIILFPDIVYYLNKKLGTGESLNTLIFIGFILLFVIIYKLLNTIERIERNITEIIRSEALSEIKNKVKKR